MATEFAGAGLPMTEEGLGAGCDRLGVGAAEVWAVLTVETLGCGYLADRRPQVLFERHIFRRETSGAFDSVAPNLSNPMPGGYGARGGFQYERLGQAIQLNRGPALDSTSWGIGQVMGFNAASAGFADVETMVAAMVQSEDQQISGMFGFLLANRLDRALRTHDWRSFARGYNGPGFADHQYDARLAAAFQKYATGLLPDLTVRAAQVYLTYLGFHPGPVDGVIGRMTQSAIRDFQKASGLPETGNLDDGTMSRLLSKATGTATPQASAAGAGKPS